MRMRSVGFAFLFLSIAAYNAAADTLTIGDAAPFAVSKWVKGDKVERFDPAKTYVVEFWATWCGPCRVSIPHLTQLQKKYKDDVVFLGVSVWEQDQEKVAPFVKEMGDKMEYRVALDEVPEGKTGNEGAMATTWMTAADEHGIPTAFIVKGGKVAWIGHPMSMDEALAKIVADKWDLEAAASERREEKALAVKITPLFQKLGPLAREKNFKAAVDLLDNAIAETPKLEKRVGMIKLRLLLQAEDSEAASAYAEKLADSVHKEDAQALNMIAWVFVDPARPGETPKGEVKVALKAAERANDLTHGESPPILDTLARALFLSGNPGRAAELQERALKLSDDKDQGLKDRLEEYKKAAKEKGA